MNLRTSNIIMICKGRHPYKDATRKEAIAKYMAETCGTDWQDYPNGILLDIVKNVVIDVVKYLEKPQEFLHDYFDAVHRTSDLEAWLTALSLIQVKDAHGFINGFEQKTLEVIDENTGAVMYPTNW